MSKEKRVISNRKDVLGKSFAEYHHIVNIKLATHCPDKWLLVDTETGDAWGVADKFNGDQGENDGEFTCASDKLLNAGLVVIERLKPPFSFKKKEMRATKRSTMKVTKDSIRIK